jgi:tetratricopeptide (TPR) repeat protein
LFQNQNDQIPFYAVVLFAAMPIHTEVVTSIKNRDILLCFIFAMLSLKNYQFFYESDFKRWGKAILAVFFLYLGIMSKFDALPYVAAIPGIFLIRDSGKATWAVLSFFLLVIAFYVFKATRRGFLDLEEANRLYYYFENPMYFEKGLSVKVTALLNSLGFYVVQCIYPIKQVCYYGYDTVRVVGIGPYGYVGIVSVPLLAFGLIRSFIKKEIVVFTGLVMFITSVSMYLNFVKPAVGIVADRFTFFASAGFSIAMVGVLFNYFNFKNARPNNFKIGGIAVLLLFAVNVVSRNADWKDINSIIDADVNKYPNNAYLNYKQALNLVKFVETNAAQMSIEQRKPLLTKARQHLEKSIEVEPNYANSRNYISYVLVYLFNDFKAALPHINHSLAYKTTPELLFYKAIVMRETNHKDSAEIYLKKSIEMDNTFYNGYSLLMYDYNAAKDFQKSLDMLNAALEDGIATEQIYFGLAKTYEAMGDTARAKENFREVIKLNPANPEAAQKAK